MMEATNDTQRPASPREGNAAAFFDIDGTLVHTNIVHYYIYFRRRLLPPLVRDAWKAAYLVRCLHYLWLDRVDRLRLNVLFYRDYRGLSVSAVQDLVARCHEEIILPRRYPAGFACVEEHRGAGRPVVLVTGSIDFIMAPLARELEVDAVLCPRLLEKEGRFTGELDGPPVGAEEKPRRMEAYAEKHGIDLAASFAYGDSIADLPMLEAVGHPQAVNPDKRLRAVAQSRGWPIHTWTEVDAKSATQADSGSIDKLDAVEGGS